MGADMRRREFISLVGGAAATWPIAALAQRPAMPVIGFLGAVSFDGSADRLRAFRLGLKDNGYIEGENVVMEYRWTENQLGQLAELATDLVRRRVSVIVTSGGPSSAAAAKAATTTIPVVFIVNEDPVKLGLVTSLARPNGNLTGVNIFLSELAAKRLGLLRELLPTATRVAVLVNPVNAVITESTLRDVDAAARSLGLQIQVVRASTALEINSAFAAFARERPDALVRKRRSLFP